MHAKELEMTFHVVVNEGLLKLLTSFLMQIG